MADADVPYVSEPLRGPSGESRAQVGADLDAVLEASASFILQTRINELEDENTCLTDERSSANLAFRGDHLRGAFPLLLALSRPKEPATD